MSTQSIFFTHLGLGYVAGLLCFTAYIWPWLKSMDQLAAQRAIATFHSFRFFGLVFILPGLVGPNLPHAFAEAAAFGDFATGILAMLALAAIRLRPVFWTFAAAFNVVGAGDILFDYYNATRFDLPAHAGDLAATYAIPIIYVPMLMITHMAAFFLLLRGASRQVRPPMSS
jgi:hypothetical protein